MTKSNGAWERFALIVLAIIGIGLISVSSEQQQDTRSESAVPGPTSAVASQAELPTLAATQAH